MKNRHVSAGLFFLVLAFMFCITASALAATLTINSDTQMDKLEISSGDTVVMQTGQDYTLDLTGTETVFANSGTFTPPL